MSSSTKIQHILPLTPMQEGILFHYLKSPLSEAYTEQTLFTLQGDLEMEILFQSFEILVARHDVLRTVFLYKNVEKPKQIVLYTRKCNVLFDDMHTGDEEYIKTFITSFQMEDRKRGFDLSRDMPIRLAVFRIGNQSYRFIISFHHIILDGWSFGLLLGEFFQIYQQIRANQDVHRDKNHSFREYVKWINSRNHDLAYAYWKQLLNEFEHASHVMREESGLENKKFDQAQKSLIFARSETDLLKTFTQKHGLTLNTLLQCVWGILLQRYNNTDDVVFGSVVSGRHVEASDVDKTVGLLINCIPVRIQTSSEMTILDLLHSIHKQQGESNKYDFCNLSTIQSNQDFSGDMINHVMVFENYVKDAVINAFLGEDNSFPFQMDDVEIFEQTNYDFNLLVIPGDSLQIKVIYNGLVYTLQKIERILGHLKQVIHEICENPHLAVDQINILPESEIQRLLHEFQPPEMDMPDFKPMQEWFEEQVAQSPDQIAIQDHSGEITYGELNARANQWAWYLKKQGVQPEVIVGVLMERSIDLVVALLAILKAGGAYLPLDINTPVARVQKIIQSSRMKCLLIHSSYVDRITSGIPIFCIDQEKAVRSHSIENPPHIVDANSLMYVIYTSGSTGEPKGVMIEHGGFHTLLCNHQNLFCLTSDDRCTQVASPAFDAMVLEVWPCLAQGAVVCFVPDSICKDPLQLRNWIVTQRITFSFQITAIAEFLISLEWPDLSCLRLLCTGGDRLKKFPKLSLPFKFYNLYGPTEDSVVTTYYPVMDADSNFYNPPIGYPLKQHQLYIFDNKERMQPIGCIGELYIGGVGLARGYLNDTQLTKQKYIKNQFSKKGRLYKTGDLVRWSNGGVLEYIGRKDFQVQISGHRIELGEIETVFMKFSGINDCAVCAVTDSGIMSLCVYYTSDQSIEVDDLKTNLLKHLPNYMIPKYFFQLESFPYNINGKIDRGKLVRPRHIKTDFREIQTPRNKIQKALHTQWMRILEMDEIDIHDHFFELGGNSIKAIQLQAQLSGDYEILIQDLYECPTIARLAEKIMRRPTNIKISLKSIQNRIQSINPELLSSALDSNLIQYKNRISNEVSQKLSKPMLPQNILLTGATGFLGIHLLNDLLSSTNARIFCIIRGADENHVRQRLQSKLQFYFQDDKQSNLNSRVQFLVGDIGEKQLGLSPDKYNQLTSELDFIVNAAANVKHVGHTESFYKTNVQSVSELIRLMTLGNEKTLHHISTASVGLAYSKSDRVTLFTEFDEHENLSHENPYIQSKLQAESLIFKARQQGLDARIYRVGNLVFHSKTGRFQENIQENAFYNVIRALFNLSIVPKLPQISLELSSIDLVSGALNKLFFQKEFFQKTFHVYNANTIKIGTLGAMLNQLGHSIRVLSGDVFFNELFTMIESDKESDHIHAIHQYLKILTSDQATHCFPSNEKTNMLLTNFNFHWPAIDLHDIGKMFKYGQSVDFW